MARIRQIKPQFFVDEDIGKLSMPARLMFIGLWTIADKEGRLEDKPGTIKVQTLPFDAIDPEEVLTEIASHGHIHRYSVGGRRYLTICAFVKHQKPHPREPASTIPAPGLAEESHGRAMPKPGQAMLSHGEPKTKPEQHSLEGPAAESRVQAMPSSADSGVRILDPNSGGSGSAHQTNQVPVPDVPRSGFDLQRLHEIMRLKRWPMPPRTGQWDAKDASVFMASLPAGVEKEIRPALKRYFADETQHYVRLKHPLDLFCKDFDAFRGPPEPGRWKPKDLELA